MAWQDRPYYRDRDETSGGPIGWLMNGSVPLFTLFGIRVRMHVSLIIILVFVLLLGWGTSSDSVLERVQSVLLLGTVILLHEFGHCFGARWTGGEANEIMLWPLGGLAMTMARRRPWPQFITVAAGPAVNVIICLVCGAVIWGIAGIFPLTPYHMLGHGRHITGETWRQVANTAYWMYILSYALLIFNLLPLYPLDGGQLLQAILWKPMGYFRSMMLTLNVGLVGAAILAMVGLATLGVIGGGFLLIWIAVNNLFTCYQTRQMLRTEGPWAFSEEDSPDYGAVQYDARDNPRRRRKSILRRWATRRAQKQAKQDAMEQGQIDAILAKVSAHGMHSLTRGEKRALRRATERQRRRDEDLISG